jgi:ABC-type transport system substrate-binding protein
MRTAGAAPGSLVASRRFGSLAAVTPTAIRLLSTMARVRRSAEMQPGDGPDRGSEPVGAWLAPQDRFGRRALLRAMAAIPGALAAPHLLRTPASVAQEQTRGGTYRILTGNPFETLDVALAFSYFDWWLSGKALYNRLYTFGQDGQLVPDLAEGMPEVSADGLTYTVKIKRGVAFHNGRELTAEDVKFSFDRNAWPELGGAGPSFLGNIVGFEEANVTAEPPDPGRGLSGIKLIDPTTVSFTLKRPQSTFPAVMSVSIFGIIPKQEVIDAGADWGTNVVLGTGPFKLTEWVPNERLVLERHAAYFREGRPYLDRIELAFNVTKETQVLRWESGEAELIAEFAPAELARIRADPELGGRIREAPSLIFYRLGFADNVEPFADVRVRRAIAMAIDKETLAARSQNGTPVESFLLPGLPQADPGFASPYRYDPEGAKTLLAEAGLGEGTKVSFLSGGLTDELGDLLHADLEAIGLDVELLHDDGVSYDVFKDRIESGEIPMVVWGFAFDYPDAATFLQNVLVCPETPIESAWCDPRIAELIAQSDALALADPTRTELIRQIEHIAVNENVQFVPLYARNALILGQDWVHGDTPDLVFTLPVLEEVWLDPR